MHELQAPKKKKELDASSMPAFEEVILYDTVQLSIVCGPSLPFLLSDGKVSP